MHEKLRNQLNAYLDGELHGVHLQEMQAHLESCEQCREELERLEGLSDLLKTAPTPEFKPLDQFISQMKLQLPRRERVDLPRRSVSPAWWLVPAGLIGAWFFIHTVFTLTNLVSAAETTGLLGQAANWLGSSGDALWFTATTSLLGRQVLTVQPTLSLLNTLNVFGFSIINGFFWQAVIVLLYWVWLAACWLGRGPREFSLQSA